MRVSPSSATTSPAGLDRLAVVHGWHDNRPLQCFPQNCSPDTYSTGDPRIPCYQKLVVDPDAIYFTFFTTRRSLRGEELRDRFYVGAYSPLAWRRLSENSIITMPPGGSAVRNMVLYRPGQITPWQIAVFEPEDRDLGILRILDGCRTCGELVFAKGPDGALALGVGPRTLGIDVETKPPAPANPFCGLHRHVDPVSGSCVCDKGFVDDGTGQACVSASGGPKTPADACTTTGGPWDGTSCTCPEGWTPSGGGCLAPPPPPDGETPPTTTTDAVATPKRTWLYAVVGAAVVGGAYYLGLHRRGKR